MVSLCAVTAAAQAADYDQQWRPQVHFSPQRNWTNDPNGLVFFRNQYNLFFQYNPEGDEWGHMSWGHAAAPDALHWRQLPVAIPEQNGIMIFTGSVVVDRQNTSGFCAAGSACLVAIYTGASPGRQTQNLAYSLDNGLTWTKYAENPVLDLHLADFRDPSVAWDDAEHHWRMAVSLPKEHRIAFYMSPDLKHWKHLSDFGGAGDRKGDWECPDLVRVPGADGKESIWALKVGINPGALQGGSGEEYFLGKYEHGSFALSTERGAVGWTNYGKDDYCAISFNGLPEGAQPILLGWMNNWQYAAKLPTSPWRGQMSLPRRLSFLRDAAGLALRQEPLIAPLRTRSLPISALLSGGEQKTAATITAPYELDLEFPRPPRGTFGLRLYADDQHWTEIGFNVQRAEFYIDRTHSGLQISPEFSVRTEAPMQPGRPLNLRVVVDRSSVEAYAQDGTIAMTDLIFPPSQRDTIRSFSEEGQEVPITGTAWQLKSIWTGNP